MKPVRPVKHKRIVMAPTPRSTTPAPARIGILVVAYNAETTLVSVLDRIAPDFRQRITKVLVSDDHSTDETFRTGVDYLARAELPIEVVHQSRNLGYGGNQKAGYHWAMANELDIVVMLHGDGQYAPEMLPELVAPLERGEADAVFGSRMIDKGSARSGGMPLYKFAGNRALTRVQNALTGAELSEWHSGYRAYRVDALRSIPFERNDPGFRFDTQIILQLLEAGKRIVEVPIPTFYGDEVCYVNGPRYASQITADVIRYRAHRVGLGSGDLTFQSELRTPFGETQLRLLSRFDGTAALRILHLGPDDDELARRLRDFGHEVVCLDDALGVRAERTAGGIDPRLDDDLAAFEAATADKLADFDVVLALDVLARTRDPERLLRALHSAVRPFGKLFVSIANIEHWYPRLRIGIGQFDYDQRGALDRSHMRLFIDRSMRRLATRCGWWVAGRETSGLPFDTFTERSPAAGAGRTLPRWIRAADQRLAARWGSMFGYSFLFELEAAAPRGAARATVEHPEPEKVDLGVPEKLRAPLQ